jgi:hypothetical protein
MSSPRRLAAALSTVCLVLAVASCTDTRTPDADEIHSRVVEVLRLAATTPLPAGDTLLSWNGGRPVLIHTGRRDSAGVAAGMLRFDRMEGVADVRWDRHSHSPTSFEVRWITPKKGIVDSTTISGVASDGLLEVTRTGEPDTAFVLPESRWAVADYGMEELLLPLFDGPPQTTEQHVVVFRPYGLKWDTLSLSTATPDSAWLVATWTEGEPPEQWRAAVLGGRHLLWLRRSSHPDDEKRPLEQTPLRKESDRLRPALAPATTPVAP